MKSRLCLTAISSCLFGFSLAAGDPAVSQGAAPQPTQAEQELKKEQDFHARLSAIASALDTLNTALLSMRRSLVPAPAVEVERLERELSAAEKELAQLALSGTSQLSQFQREEQIARVGDLRFMLASLKQRWESSLPLFGRKAFQTPSPEAPPKTAPKGYRLRIGDRIVVNIASRIGAGRDYPVAVDRSGHVSLAGAGKVLAAGRTLAELQADLRRRISGKFSQLAVNVTFDSFAQTQVQVMGEVERPGSVLLASSATLSDALRAAGGPTDAASLRRIRVTSANGAKKIVDLYQLLIKGQRQADLPLKDGDLVFVPALGPSVAIYGEVARPARYELLSGVTLSEAVSLAGGPKPGAATRHVVVQRTVSGEYRELLNEPLQNNSNFTVLSGDEIQLKPVAKDQVNRVSINGPVRSGGIFAFAKGMRVKDLVERAQGFKPEAEVFQGRADILRYDPMQGARLVTIHLGKALEADPANNIELQPYDSLFIYTPDQVEFQPRVVTVAGALAKPGVYRRTPGMRVRDAVAAAGGTLPEAYLSRANLVRRIGENKTELIAIDLSAALSGDQEANKTLQDRDEITVFTYQQARFKEAVVKVEGAVQRPGTVRRSEKMRLSDLLFSVGGLLPEADPMVDVARVKPDGGVLTLQVDARALSGNPDFDILLQDNDVVTVRSIASYESSPSIVYLAGEVAKPGPYAIDPKKDRIADVIRKAGGLTELAQSDGTIFLRKKSKFANQVQDEEADALLARTKLLSDREFLLQLTKLGLSAPSSTQTGTTAKPIDTAPQQLTEEKKKGVDDEKTDLKGIEKEDKPKSAFGDPIAPIEDIDKQKLQQVDESIRVSIRLELALNSPKAADNLLLADGDRIYIPRKTGVVTVIGAVLHPHRLAASETGSFASYIARAGGYAPDAAPRYGIVIRANGDALPARKVKLIFPGDMIVIPTTGLVDVTRKIEQVKDVTKAISDVLSSVFILTKL